MELAKSSDILTKVIKFIRSSVRSHSARLNTNNRVDAALSSVWVDNSGKERVNKSLVSRITMDNRWRARINQ